MIEDASPQTPATFGIRTLAGIVGSWFHQDSYLCWGDNRGNSNDSRYWGFLPIKNITGKAMLEWYPHWRNL